MTYLILHWFNSWGFPCLNVGLNARFQFSPNKSCILHIDVLSMVNDRTTIVMDS